MFDTKLTFTPSLIWNEKINYHYNKIIAKSFDCIDHFAVNLILPDKTAIALCPNYKYLINYNQLQIDKLEVALSPWRLDNFPVIPWRLILNGNDSRRFNQLIQFKEAQHNLYSGMTFIAKFDDCYLTVGVATNKKNPKYALTLMQNMGEILNMGAHLYELFRPELRNLYEKEPPILNEIILNDGQYLIAEEFSKKWRDLRCFTLPTTGEDGGYPSRSKFFSTALYARNPG